MRQNPRFAALVAKHGDLRVEIIRSGLTRAEAVAAEEALIASHQRLGGARLINLVEGVGSKGLKVSAETRAKIAAYQTGRKQSPETIEKRVAHMRGRKQDPEAVAKRVAAYTDEMRAKMSAATKGRKQTPEQVAKRMAATAATKARNASHH